MIIRLNSVLFLFLLLASNFIFAQEGRQIDYESDRTIRNEIEYPGATILSKVENQVHFTHEGIEVWCDQAIHYAEDNFFMAYGNVKMNQGDTITLDSEYAEYNGNTQFAFASGNVRMNNPQTTLETDTLFFNRIKQEAYYRSGGTVRDTASVLQSDVGRYYLEDEKYTFLSDVVLTNPEYVINSAQMDFYTDTGHVYFYGPTTINSETSTIYCERGFYDTRGDTGYFVRNSRIDYENRVLEGDSLYFDRNTNFASGTNNIKVTDTMNNSIIKGHYAEVFRDRDSLFITKRAVAISAQEEQDSLYIHADTLMVTGPPEDRIIRGFYDVRLYRSDMSGKSDSLHVSQVTGVTKMLGNPVLWSGQSQMTGDTIHLLNNLETDQLDSLKVFDNAFVVQKDSIEGYNQIKGKELFGLFEDNELYQADLYKNTETLYYPRSSDGSLIGINKTLSSSIQINFTDQEIDEIIYFQNVDGNLFTEQEVPQEERELPGFIWRGDEQLHSVEDLFKGDPPLELTEIRGIPLQQEDEEFFEEEDTEGTHLLNERSRLEPEDLQNKREEPTSPKRDSIPVQTPLRVRDSLESGQSNAREEAAATQVVKEQD